MSLRAAARQIRSCPGRPIWYRADRPDRGGAAVSQAMRAMIAADFSNGTSSVLDFREWTFSTPT